MAGIVWWEVETARPEEFQRFHEAMWGWEFHPAFGDIGAAPQTGPARRGGQGSGAFGEYWVIVSEGRGIGGLQRGSGEPAAGTRVYLEVEDLEGVLGVAEAFGADVERTRTSIGDDGRWFARFRDPAGVSFGLWCESPPVA